MDFLISRMTHLTTPLTKVTCVPLYSLLLALDNPTVDYMSLDIEGAELSVLKTVPWESVDIREERKLLLLNVNIKISVIFHVF